MKIRSFLINPFLYLSQSLQGAHVPRISENNKPHHPRDKKIINHHEDDNTRQIFTGTGLRFAQSSIFSAHDVVPGLGPDELHYPAAVWHEKAEVYVEDGKGWVLVGGFPVHDESDDGEEVEEQTEEWAVRD